MTLHHVGCLVRTLEESIEYYRDLHPSISAPVHIESQGVRVSFVDTGTGVSIELVEPDKDNSVVHQLRRRGIVFYHLGYLVTNFEAQLRDLSDKNYKQILE